MALPYSREMNVADGGPVPASVYNAIQDAIIALKSAERTIMVPLTLYGSDTHVDGTPADYRNTSIGLAMNGTPGDLYLDKGDANTSADPVMGARLPLHVGDRIKSVDLWCSDNNSDPISLALYKQALSTGSAYGSGASQIGSTQTTVNSANYQKLSVSSLTEVVAADTLYTAWIELTRGSHNSTRVYSLFCTYDRVAP